MLFFYGECNLEHNQAANGGAILATESKLNVNGDVTIAHNDATRNGGGVYLLTSELNCLQDSTFVLHGNSADNRGGGFHAVSSSIKATYYYYYPSYLGTKVILTNNTAKFGGGLSLEANAKLNILKYGVSTSIINTVIFTTNHAEYGGAVYLDDDSDSGTCAGDPESECFFQVLAIYFSHLHNFTTKCIYFSHNSASISGSNLYGGLLDRCAVSTLAEVYKRYGPSSVGGTDYFMKVSSATYDSISSDPVQVCLCTNGIDKCDHQSHI